MIDWGSVPDWFGVAFTGAGFAAAVYQLREGRRDQQQERDQARADEAARQEAMARAVGVKIDWGETDERRRLTSAEVEVFNGAPYPIDGVVIVVSADDYPMEVVVGTMLPGRTLKETYEVRRREVVFGELTSGAKLLFTDTYGNHWSRTGQGLNREEFPARIC